MNDQQTVFLTQTGLDNLKQELKVLKEDKLPQAIDRVAKAREFGDLSENSEYHAAREDHAWIQGRIEELEGIMTRAKVVSNTNGSSQVAIGCQVQIEVGGSVHEFSIVGEWEADPAAKKISHQSPLGQALLGKKVGDKVEVEAPAGKLTYLIKGIK